MSWVVVTAVSAASAVPAGCYWEWCRREGVVAKERNRRKMAFGTTGTERGGGMGGVDPVVAAAFVVVVEEVVEEGEEAGARPSCQSSMSLLY